MSRFVRKVRVRVPATSANLGPGFDCLALALDLWNETTFSLEGEGLTLHSQGEGCDIPPDERNLLLQGMRVLCRTRGLPFPENLTIQCRNDIPVGSGLGSSAAASLTGLLGAAALLGQPLEALDALELCAGMEGHADNAAAAVYGGLVAVAAGKEGWLVRSIAVPPLDVAVVLPEISLSTQAARAALPEQVAFEDAAFNLGRVVLVVEALRSGDLSLLNQAADDRLHQPYRLPLIPGGKDAIQAAYQAGASAVTISGAGPSLIAFTAGSSNAAGSATAAADAMTAAFQARGVQARAFTLHASQIGARVEDLIG